MAGMMVVLNMMKGNKMIYVVTSGEYSDYGIRAIFTTREKAEAYVAWKNGPEDEDVWDGSEYRIEEYEEDSEVEKDTGTFVCEFTYHEGSDPADYHGGYVHWKCDEVVQPPTAIVDQRERTYKDPPVPYLTVVGYGPSSKHALRSALETLRAIKAGTLLVDGTTKVLTDGIIL